MINQLEYYQINDMKKYSSYADLKISKYNAYDAKSPKAVNSPAYRKPFALDLPVMLLSKDSFPIPATTKYSAGYLQRKKIFSSKKDGKESTKENQVININDNHLGKEKTLTPNNKKESSKPKKVFKKDPSHKKQKVQLELKEQTNRNKQQRMDVQSPKASGDLLQSKTKSKIKDKEKSQKQKKIKNAALTISTTKIQKKMSEKIKKQENVLNDFVYKYDPQPKGMLSQCTSDPNLMRGFKSPNTCKGYYVETIFNAYFSTKVSSFHQICKNHLATSIDFLSYARKTKNFMPKRCQNAVILSPTNKKTIIFDLDQTLIHCNQSVDMPNDVVLDISFPNNTKIQAGINIRPFARECLKELSEHFQIIVFTASHECYANVIIDHLDPQKKYISHRLFRDHCYKTNEGFYVKDLRILNRDLANVLLVDNAAYSYCFQPENGVPIIPFYNNKTDWELKEVTAYLKGFIGAKNMRIKNECLMRLSEYHRFKSPRELINQLYM